MNPRSGAPSAPPPLLLPALGLSPVGVVVVVPLSPLFDAVLPTAAAFTVIDALAVAVSPLASVTTSCTVAVPTLTPLSVACALPAPLTMRAAPVPAFTVHAYAASAADVPAEPLPSSVIALPTVTLDADSPMVALGGVDTVAACAAVTAAPASSSPAPQVLVVQ